MGRRNYNCSNPNNPRNHSARYINNLYSLQPGNVNTTREQIRQMWNNTLDHSNTIYNEFENNDVTSVTKFERIYWNDFFIFWDRKTNRPHKGLEFAKPMIIGSLYENSGVGVVMVGEDALVYRLAAYYRNAFFRITSASGIIYAYPMDPTLETPNFSLMNRFDLTNENCALELSDVDAIPWNSGVYAFAKRLADTQGALALNRINSLNVKLIQASGNSENKIKEIGKINMGSAPFHVIDGDIDGISSIATPNQQRDLWEDHWNLWKRFMLERGLRTNLDAKRERNIAAEVGNNNVSYLIQEGWKRRVLEDLCKEINRLFGTDVTIKNRMEVQEIQDAMVESIEGVEVEKAKGDWELEREKLKQDNNDQEGDD